MTGIPLACGKVKLIYGAKAFSSVPEFANGTGVRMSLPPAQDPLPTFTNDE